MDRKRKNSGRLSQDRRAVQTWLDAPQVMIWMTDEKHHCVYGNQALMDYFGFDMDQLSGLNWLETIHPDDRERLTRQQQFAASNFQNFRQEYRAKGRNKTEYIWVTDTSVPRFDAKGRFAGYIGSVIDITEQKLREEGLKEKQKVLEQEILKISDREKSRIGRDLHDELSQHLLVVAFKAMLLERKLKKKKLPESAVAGEIMLEMNKLVSKARGVSQSLFLDLFHKKDFVAMLEELSKKVRANFKSTMKMRIPDSFAIDPEKSAHLFRIVQEAVTNAVRHGRASKIEVGFSSASNGNHLLEIRDDGRGLPEGFERSEGMGLHIMEYRAKMIGGTLKVLKREGGGTAIVCQYAP